MSKEQKVVVSFKTSRERASRWKAYAAAVKAKDMGELYSGAMDEFVERHPLTEEQKAVYSTLVSADGYSTDTEPTEVQSERKVTHENEVSDAIFNADVALDKMRSLVGILSDETEFSADSMNEALSFATKAEDLHTLTSVILDYVFEAKKWVKVAQDKADRTEVDA